jgi:hypothetical protein
LEQSCEPTRRPDCSSSSQYRIDESCGSLGHDVIEKQPRDCMNAGPSLITSVSGEAAPSMPLQNITTVTKDEPLLARLRLPVILGPQR